jgi:excisionase family DNA binding protein
MGPEREGETFWFSVPEAASVLGLTRQAVYAAINTGQLPAKKTASGFRIGAQDLLGYGVRTGKDPQLLIRRAQEETGADLEDLLRLALIGLGLYLLVKALFGGK